MVLVGIYFYQENRMANLASQLKCATSAKEFFDNHSVPDNKVVPDYSYNDHYSQRENGCFILIKDINYEYKIDNETLYNVYENTIKGMAISADGIGNNTAECNVNGRECKSMTEFHDLLRKIDLINTY